MYVPADVFRREPRDRADAEHHPRHRYCRREESAEAGMSLEILLDEVPLDPGVYEPLGGPSYPLVLCVEAVGKRKVRQAMPTQCIEGSTQMDRVQRIVELEEIAQQPHPGRDE